MRGGRGSGQAPAPGASACALDGRGGSSRMRVRVRAVWPQGGRAPRTSLSDGCDVTEPWARKQGPRSRELALASECPPPLPRGRGAEGLSVAHPGGHFFLLGTRGRQVSSRGAADACTRGRVAAASRGPSLWATPDGAGSRQLQLGKPRRPPEGPDGDGVCGARPAGADRSRRRGRTAGCAGKAAFTKLVSWPRSIHSTRHQGKLLEGSLDAKMTTHRVTCGPAPPACEACLHRSLMNAQGRGWRPGAPCSWPARHLAGLPAAPWGRS